jgi:ribosomal protein S18 acetylase RimI-like enzyme
MVQLVPMSEAVYAEYLPRSIAEYAEEKVKAGNFLPEDALQRSEGEFRELLPKDLQTPDNYLYSIVNDAGENVGILWVAHSTRGGKSRAFVYDFAIDEAHRRKGYGEQAFVALEAKVKELGLDTISLHVFGHNHAARALYEKLGYVTTNISMEKKLTP